MEYEILKARESAERTLGFAIDDETAEEVLAYAKRKCELNRKPDEYLPLLYENELTELRPVDQAAVMRLIRASKGSIAIPGIAYREVAKMSFRR